MARPNKTGIDWSDPKQSREYIRKHNKKKYNNDPEFKDKCKKRDKEAGDKRSYENQTKAFQLIGIFGCSNEDCNHNAEYYSDIDWHHQKPENKTANLGWMFRNNSWKKVKKELIEGDVIPLCKVCHARLEYKRRPIPLNRGKELEEYVKTRSGRDTTFVKSY